MGIVLKVEHLKKSYGQLEAVKDVGFEVHQGEVFALIGPNGAGKTTTLRVVSTLLTPSGGTVSLNGFDLKTHPEAFRERISYLPEEAGAYRNLKARSYLEFMARFYADTPDRERGFLARAEAICGLGARLEDKVGTYSKGMVRKLLLARALMTQPALTILDEPTSGLDVIASLEVREIIKRQAREGISVLLSSHNMLEIEYLSDRVALIDKGLILDSGTPAELKSKYKAENLEVVFRSALR
jgi:ABC-2 type transport system ATP-binding protein